MSPHFYPDDVEEKEIYDGPEWPEYFYGPRFFRGHCADVLAGCYDVPLEIEKPVILDIGANVGAFARWALKRYPNATVHCYEPEPSNFQKLSEILNGDPRTRQNNCAIGASRGKVSLSFDNRINCGEFFCVKGDDVTMLDANEIPEAEIIKLDTEGCEPEILTRLSYCKRLTRTKAIMLEWHNGGHVPYLIVLLRSNGFDVHSCEQAPYSVHRGILKFLRK